MVSDERRIIPSRARKVDAPSFTGCDAIPVQHLVDRSAGNRVIAGSRLAVDAVRHLGALRRLGELDVNRLQELSTADAEQELLDAQVSLTLSRRDEIVAGFQVFSAVGGLTASNFGLAVDLYDPVPDYLAVRNLWFGLDVPGE